jgi:hypothetical protein
MQRETAGVFFCSVLVRRESFYIAAYVDNARTLALPLVGGGEHDGNIILGQLRILRHDHYIAATVRVCGWFIMISLIIWFLAMGIKKTGDG